MMKNRFLTGVAVAALLCGVAALVYFTGPSVDEVVESPTPKVSTTQKPSAVKSPKRTSKNRDKELLVPVKGAPGSYKIELPKDEEASLTDAYRKLLNELRNVTDPLDRKKLLELVQRMQKSDEWPDGIPSILHMAAIEALSEMGADGASELAGYLESGDADVREEAMDAIVDSVDDDTLSDREKAEMIKNFSRYVNDPDALESMFDIIDMDMRNSVQYETLVDILKNGTPAAKDRLMKETIPEVIDLEDDLQSPQDALQKLDEWVKENPDDEDDDETYAGTPKDPDDDDDDD